MAAAGCGRRKSSNHRGQPSASLRPGSEPLSAFERGSLFVRCYLLLDRHVFQFAGLENLAAFPAFQVFGFFVAGNDLHLRMPALLAADSRL